MLLLAPRRTPDLSPQEAAWPVPVAVAAPQGLMETGLVTCKHRTPQAIRVAGAL